MAFNQLYDMCMNATLRDEHYCKQVVNAISRLSRERVVAYVGERGVRRVVVLPSNDIPLVDIVADNNRNLIVKIKSERYVAMIKYAYDGELRPTYAVVSNPEIVNMLNMHIPLKDVLNEVLIWRVNYGP